MEIVFFFSSARWERFIVVEYDIDYSLLFLSVQKFRLSVIYIYPFSVFPLGLKERKKGCLSPLLHSFKKKKTDDKNQNKSFLLTFTRHSERTPPRHKTTRTTRRRKRIQKRKSNTSSTKTATSFRNTFQWTNSSNRTTSSTSRSCILR